jgi:hypothetical protein
VDARPVVVAGVRLREPLEVHVQPPRTIDRGFRGQRIPCALELERVPNGQLGQQRLDVGTSATERLYVCTRRVEVERVPAGPER